jgi:hypothetical protein
MTIANVVFLIGTSCLFIKILKNRNSIKDFDTFGSGITFIGMCFSGLALIELKLWISLIFMIPTLLFWLFATVFSMKKTK